jgi:hypothetical protein
LPCLVAASLGQARAGKAKSSAHLPEQRFLLSSYSKCLAERFLIRRQSPKFASGNEAGVEWHSPIRSAVRSVAVQLILIHMWRSSISDSPPTRECTDRNLPC